MTTNTRVGQLAFLEARHRAHARVEDRIRQAQNAGLHRLPSRVFSINAAWLMLALAAAHQLAWTQTILLTSTDDQTKAWPGRSGRRSATGSCTPGLASPARPGASTCT